MEQHFVGINFMISWEVLTNWLVSCSKMMAGMTSQLAL